MDKLNIWRILSYHYHYIHVYLTGHYDKKNFNYTKVALEVS